MKQCHTDLEKRCHNGLRLPIFGGFLHLQNLRREFHAILQQVNFVMNVHPSFQQMLHQGSGKARHAVVDVETGTAEYNDLVQFRLLLQVDVGHHAGFQVA